MFKTIIIINNNNYKKRMRSDKPAFGIISLWCYAAADYNNYDCSS